MRFLQYLQEDYLDTFVSTLKKEEPFEVFVNPDKKEISLLRNDDIRFVVDNKSKKVYVWNARVEIHDSVVKKLQQSNDMKLKGTFYDSPDVFAGLAKSKDGKMFILDSHDIQGGIIFFKEILRPSRKKTLIDKLKIDWSWAEQYFTNLDEFMDSCREDLKKYGTKS